MSMSGCTYNGTNLIGSRWMSTLYYCKQNWGLTPSTLHLEDDGLESIFLSFFMHIVHILSSFVGIISHFEGLHIRHEEFGRALGTVMQFFLA